MTDWQKRAEELEAELRAVRTERDDARGALSQRIALRRDIEEILGVESGPVSDEQLARGVGAVKALRERAEDAERKLGEAHDTFAACHRRAEDAERRCDEWKRDCWQQATTIGRVVSMLGFEPGTWNSVDLPRSVADLRTRAEDAERKLAALHAAVGGEGFARAAWHGTVGVAMADALERVRAAWSDASPVAERHDREVRVKELRRVADLIRVRRADTVYLTGSAEFDAARALCNEADRIERGGTETSPARVAGRVEE